MTRKDWQRRSGNVDRRLVAQIEENAVAKGIVIDVDAVVVPIAILHAIGERVLPRRARVHQRRQALRAANIDAQLQVGGVTNANPFVERGSNANVVALGVPPVRARIGDHLQLFQSGAPRRLPAQPNGAEHQHANEKGETSETKEPREGAKGNRQPRQEMPHETNAG